MLGLGLRVQVLRRPQGWCIRYTVINIEKREYYRRTLLAMAWLGAYGNQHCNEIGCKVYGVT